MANCGSCRLVIEVTDGVVPLMVLGSGNITKAGAKAMRVWCRSQGYRAIDVPTSGDGAYVYRKTADRGITHYVSIYGLFVGVKAGGQS